MRKVLSFLKWALFSIAVIFAVLAIWFATWLGNGETAATTTPRDSNQKSRITAGVACQTAIKQNLKNPSSAEFVDRLKWPATIDDGVWTIKATYRGANGFGGVVTETITCKALEGSFSAVLIR